MFGWGINPTTALHLARVKHRQLLQGADHAPLVQEARAFRTSFRHLLASQAGGILISLGARLKSVGAGVDAPPLPPVHG